MARFGANENAFDALVLDSARQHGVDPALIKAHIAAETQPPFNPASFRAEPRGNASIGLMQVLRSNAPGLTDAQLFDPATNIDRGTAIIAANLAHANGDLDAAISAYNGGWNVTAAMGVRATRPLTVCIARDPQGNCLRTRSVKPGEFGNQPYVDKVKLYYDYFRRQFAAAAAKATESMAAPTVATTSVMPSGRSAGAVAGALLSAIFLGILYWLRKRHGGQ